MENLTPFLEQLAEKFGTTVEHLWEVMINQSQIFVAYYTIFFIVVGVLLLAMIIYAIWAFRTDNYYEDGYAVVLIVGWIIVVCLVTACAILSYEVVTAIKNPEFWALEQILKS